MNNLVKKDIAVLVGSLRKESYSRQLAEVMQKLAPATWELQIIEIGNLPLYNEDLEGDGIEPPVNWVQFRERVGRADGVLLVTPEYNRSATAALKNALDVGSRPYDKNVWSNKPTAIVSVSQGAIGGFGANHHLRQTLVCLNCPVLPLPEMYLGGVAGLFNEKRELVEGNGVDKLITRFFSSYERWLARF